MTVHDVRRTQGNDLSVIVMQYFLHKSTSVVKESIPVCIEMVAHGFELAKPVILQGCQLCNMTFHKKFARKSACVKLVISVNCCVDSELARCRHRTGCFPKLVVRSNFST